jgi:hypothetical protein
LEIGKFKTARKNAQFLKGGGKYFEIACKAVNQPNPFNA